MPHHHIKPAQFELFALSDKANAVTTPEWQDLPAWTRRKITGLMARLLVEHSLEQRDRARRRQSGPCGGEP